MPPGNGPAPRADAPTSMTVNRNDTVCPSSSPTPAFSSSTANPAANENKQGNKRYFRDLAGCIAGIIASRAVQSSNSIFQTAHSADFRPFGVGDGLHRQPRIVDQHHVRQFFVRTDIRQ